MTAADQGREPVNRRARRFWAAYAAFAAIQAETPRWDFTVGSDGLTGWERDRRAARYAATVGKKPARGPHPCGRYDQPWCPVCYPTVKR